MEVLDPRIRLVPLLLHHLEVHHLLCQSKRPALILFGRLRKHHFMALDLNRQFLSDIHFTLLLNIP